MSYNPLTPFWLALTIGFETGLGIVAYLGAVYIVPFLKRRSAVMDLGELHEVEAFFDSRVAKFFFKKILRLDRIKRIPQRPKWFVIYYMGAFGLAFLVLFIVTGQLATSVGWVNPLSVNGLWYDLLFARANGQPNGAHIVSYLGVLALAWTVAIKYRDGPVPELFLGGLAGAFLVALHEGIWIVFYYAYYWQFLDWDLLTNVLKDVSFSSMIILFVLAFKNYPFQKMNLTIFKRPAMLFTAYCMGWFFLPIAFGYNPFPITTLNNFKYGHTVYNETAYWGDPVVNAIEVGSWLFAYALMTIAILRIKK